jgi:hypothetical protein
MKALLVALAIGFSVGANASLLTADQMNQCANAKITGLNSEYSSLNLQVVDGAPLQDVVLELNALETSLKHQEQLVPDGSLIHLACSNNPACGTER